MYYFDIIKALFENKIKYLIVGGLAVNLYGVPRVTQDIDLIIYMERENILKLNHLLKNLGYIPRLAVNPDDLTNKEIIKEWIENKNLKAFSFYNERENYKVVDIILVHPLDFLKAFERKTIKKIDETEIYIVSIDDLILMKEVVGRKQDFSDIELLKKVKLWNDEEHV
ncbi:MAG: hypothetical protein EAX96_17715 [Candidatus Lokiarchaeota archaeon]|nr:hypothetical protein [Candidatus Lokiarchaeota archaeon]